ncbi:unnamed protein product, partial [Musa textilis]
WGRDTVPGVPARRADHTALLHRDEVIGSGGADDAGPPHRVRVLSGTDFGGVGQLPGECGISLPCMISPNVDCKSKELGLLYMWV